MSGVKKLKKGEVLFKQGDPPDAMYVIKKGRIAIVVPKGQGEVTVGELKKGEMLGEMAFFDGNPRTAGAKAMEESELITLPYVALHAQFKTFPEWLKAMVKAVNAKLRDTNQKLKQLEKASGVTKEAFPDDLITKLAALIVLIGYKSGEKTPEGLNVPYSILRNYCIQIFHLPTNKMDSMMQVLASLGHMLVEDLGEGKLKVVIKSHEVLTKFVDWFYKFQFAKEADQAQQTITEREFPMAKALIHYGKKGTKDEKGMVKLNLLDVQNNSMKDLGSTVMATDVDTLAEKKITQDRQSGDNGVTFVTFDIALLESLVLNWEIVYALRKVQAAF